MQKILLIGLTFSTLMRLSGCPDDAADDDDGDDSPAMDAGVDSGPVDSGLDVGNCCTVRSETGCSVPAIQTCVCAQEPDDMFCCNNEWDEMCVAFVANCDGYENACGSTQIDGGPPDNEDAGPTTIDPDMTFFVTSRRVEVSGTPVDGGDFGGLAGADTFCTTLANEALPANGRTWRAYLSTSTVDARDRIGTGPWVNAAGQQIAADVAALHSTPPATALLLTETGETFADDTSRRHDILTGSNSNGEGPSEAELMPLFTFPDGSFTYEPYINDFSCQDWTSDGNAGGANNSYAVVGHVDHSDLAGGSASWNSSHVTACDGANMMTDLGSTRIYCFATD